MLNLLGDKVIYQSKHLTRNIHVFTKVGRFFLCLFFFQFVYCLFMIYHFQSNCPEVFFLRLKIYILMNYSFFFLRFLYFSEEHLRHLKYSKYLFYIDQTYQLVISHAINISLQRD